MDAPAASAAATTERRQSKIFDFVQEQLSVDPTQSKKFVMGLVGIGAMVFCFFVSTILWFHKPELAAPMVQALTVLFPSIAGLVSVYITGQSAVEVRANGVLQKQAES